MLLNRQSLELFTISSSSCWQLMYISFSFSSELNNNTMHTKCLMKILWHFEGVRSLLLPSINRKTRNMLERSVWSWRTRMRGEVFQLSLPWWSRSSIMVSIKQHLKYMWTRHRVIRIRNDLRCCKLRSCITRFLHKILLLSLVGPPSTKVITIYKIQTLVFSIWSVNFLSHVCSSALELKKFRQVHFWQKHTFAYSYPSQDYYFSPWLLAPWRHILNQELKD